MPESPPRSPGHHGLPAAGHGRHGHHDIALVAAEHAPPQKHEHKHKHKDNKEVDIIPAADEAVAVDAGRLRRVERFKDWPCYKAYLAEVPKGERRRKRAGGGEQAEGSNTARTGTTASFAAAWDASNHSVLHPEQVSGLRKRASSGGGASVSSGSCSDDGHGQQTVPDPFAALIGAKIPVPGCGSGSNSASVVDDADDEHEQHGTGKKTKTRDARYQVHLNSASEYDPDTPPCSPRLSRRAWKVEFEAWQRFLLGRYGEQRA